MTYVTSPSDGTGAIIVSVILDGTLATAFDTACGETLSSRAGYVRRVLAESLRQSGHLPALPSDRRKA